MLEPALLFDAELSVGEVLAQLDTYPAFEFVVVRSMQGGTTRWFMEQHRSQGPLAAPRRSGGRSSGRRPLARPDRSVECARHRRVALAGGFPGCSARARRTAGRVGARRSAAGCACGTCVRAPRRCGGARAVTATDGVTFAKDAPRGRGRRQRSCQPRASVLRYRPRRQRQARSQGLFSGGRGALRFGCIEVAIPPSHERGAVETPSWWKFEFKANPDKHLTLQSAMLFDDEAGFIEGLGRRFDAVGGHDTLVFVHGYRVGFDAAVRRTAQIAHDLRFRGAALLYSSAFDEQFLPLHAGRDQRILDGRPLRGLPAALVAAVGRSTCTSSRTAWATASSAKRCATSARTWTQPGCSRSCSQHPTSMPRSSRSSRRSSVTRRGRSRCTLRRTTWRCAPQSSCTATRAPATRSPRS